MKYLHSMVLLALILAAGCAGLPVDVAPTLSAAPPASATPPPTPQITNTPSGRKVLKLWLPPQFDPNLDTPASQILKARLEEFTARRPDVRVEVRLKALQGTGGLLDSLITASAAAPLALPDLVALPRPVLETAALKGFLHPFDDLINDLEDPDWYDYARQLARLQDSQFGQPFAGDALILVYRQEIVPEPPSTLTSDLQSEGP